MSSTVLPKALYIEDHSEPVFAVFHGVPDHQRATAVLLCPPFGWEDMCSYRSRRDWAEDLSGNGFPVLRIDLPGSGDSAGNPTDAGRLSAWTKAITVSARWLRARDGVQRVAVIGIGLGAMIAYRAASQGAPIDDLVLWGAQTKGRALLRELRAFSRLEAAAITAADEPEHPAAPDGALVVNGYLMSAETVGELEALDLAELAWSEDGSRRALLLGRDTLKVDERLAATLERAGVEVTLGDGPGYGAMMVEPQDARAPVEVFGLTSSWLIQAEATGSDRHGEAQTPTEMGELPLRTSGALIRERPIYVKQAEGRLFGVLSEPVGHRENLCAVLVNAGPQRRTGPNRMWVEIARRWASRGVTTLRIDLAGIGDSDGDASSLVQVSSLYAHDYVEQIRSVLEELRELGMPERFLALGLCSGAYWSMHAALCEKQIRSIVMLNPRALIWDEWTHAVRRTKDLRERLLLRSTWRKVLRGEITLARHIETARGLAVNAVGSLRRQAASAPESDPLDRAFDELRDRDQHALLLFTGREPLHEEIIKQGKTTRIDRWPNIDLEVLGNAADTHTLTPLWLQNQVHELVDRAMEAELRRRQAISLES
jgi:alpha-beta hydrolase superfamily lysophospholipase